MRASAPPCERGLDRHRGAGFVWSRSQAAWGQNHPTPISRLHTCGKRTFLDHPTGTPPERFAPKKLVPRPPERRPGARARSAPCERHIGVRSPTDHLPWSAGATRGRAAGRPETPPPGPPLPWSKTAEHQSFPTKLSTGCDTPSSIHTLVGNVHPVILFDQTIAVGCRGLAGLRAEGAP